MHKLIIPTSILAMTVGITPSYGQSGAAASFASTAAECSAAARLARLKPIEVRQSQREVPNGLAIIGVVQFTVRLVAAPGRVDDIVRTRSAAALPRAR